MQSLSISLESPACQWATEDRLFVICSYEKYWLQRKILYMLVSLVIECVYVCVCALHSGSTSFVRVPTWMYLNLVLFTPIVQLCLRGLLWSNWMIRGRGKPVAANAVPAGLIIPNMAAAPPALSHPLMNTEMNVAVVRGERRGETQARAVFNQLWDRTIPLFTSTAQGWISV